VRGMVSPADFIPVAEETGLIEEIGQWVLRTACAEAAAWPAHIRIAVNVSPIQFRSPTLSLKVAAALADTGLDPRRLELEVTEAVLIADDDAALVALNQLRALGIHIALDDFGTGYSSLSYLQRLPIDGLKIDRAFLRNIERDDKQREIVAAIIRLAHVLQLDVVAEGVERREQLVTLSELGCDNAQGHFISPPLPASRMRAWLAAAR
jgi:EAL domain-containing protein (putative c-di-GMP-specific phosphodiesterase class I)